MCLPVRRQCFAAVMMMVFLARGPCVGVTKIAVFPLVNKSQEKSLDWLVPLIPEYFAHRIPLCSDLQVLDPVFLFRVDSAGWTMSSDSLLRVHWLRWGWNAACGGTFYVSNARITCELRAVMVRDNRPVKKLIAESASTDSLSQLCYSLFTQFMSFIGSAVTKEQSREFGRPMSRNPQAAATYCAGYGFEMHGNPSGAITCYARAAELDPSLAPAWSRMARLYRAAGAFDKARQAFDRSLPVAEGNPAILAAAADFLADHGSPAQALEFVNKNGRVLETTADGMAAIGKALLAGGESQRAVAMLTRAVVRGPSDLEADFMLGRTYMETGQFQQACEVFNRLVRYRPDCSRFYAFLGAAYRNSGHLMESLRVLDRCAANTPDDVPVLVNLAQTYIELKMYQEARQILLHAQELAPDNPDILVSLGVLAWHAGAAAEAQTLLEKAVHLGGDVQAALNNEANILCMSGNIGKALDIYKKADKTGAKNEVVLLNLANACLTLNRLDEAAAFFESVLAMSPQRLDVLDKLATLDEKKHRPDDAVTCYRKILELSPHDAGALVKMAALLTRLGRYKEAVAPLDAYCDNYPDEKKVLVLQADIYRRMGWYEVALMKYQAITHDFANDAEGFLGMGRTMYDLFQYKDATNYDSAIACLKNASALNPADPEPQYLMGLIFMNYKQRPDAAREQWQSALPKATDPDMKRILSDLIEKAGK
jgi:tetratricopeptide (TPR) repeat protein